MDELDQMWREYWLKEGYDMNQIQPVPASRNKQRRIYKFLGWLKQEEEAREDFVEGMRRILSKTRKEAVRK